MTDTATTAPHVDVAVGDPTGVGPGIPPRPDTGDPTRSTPPDDSMRRRFWSSGRVRPDRPAVEPPALPPSLAIARGALTALAVFALGFGLTITLVSQLQQGRSQQVLYSQLREQLALGTAPVGPLDADGVQLALGAPVAILDVPTLGVRQVVVEGTSSDALRSGPGHRRDTVLPGQVGTSVIFGRQAAYGGPFAKIAGLAPEAEILVTTGQGVATFAVRSVRFAGDPQPPALADGKARLTLVSAAGTPYLPNQVVRVDAELLSTSFNGTPASTSFAPSNPLPRGALSRSEQPLQRDTSQLFALVLWSQALLVALLAVTWARRRWGRWQVWVAGVPVLLGIGLAVSSQLALLLPNLM